MLHLHCWLTMFSSSYMVVCITSFWQFYKLFTGLITSPSHTKHLVVFFQSLFKTSFQITENKIWKYFNVIFVNQTCLLACIMLYSASPLFIIESCFQSYIQLCPIFFWVEILPRISKIIVKKKDGIKPSNLWMCLQSTIVKERLNFESGTNPNGALNLKHLLLTAVLAIYQLFIYRTTKRGWWRWIILLLFSIILSS